MISFGGELRSQRHDRGGKNGMSEDENGKSVENSWIPLKSSLKKASKRF